MLYPWRICDCDELGTQYEHQESRKSMEMTGLFLTTAEHQYSKNSGD